MSSQDEVVQAVEELIAAVAVARSEMRRAEQALRRALRRITEGEAIESLILLRPPAEKRRAFLDALEEVHRTRHTARQKVFTHAQQHGLSVSELARAWGISRQLASRYLKEESAASETTAPDGAILSEAPVVQQAEAVLDAVAPHEDGDR
jgi:DNA invertase Pin-like site-specific DNA recombinase